MTIKNSFDEKANVLIVDDNTKNIFSMKVILEELDANIYTAETGQDALKLMLRHDFSVVFLDVQMPEMDGYEVAEIMSKNQSSANIPIVFVTAIQNDIKHIKAGYDAGAIDYLSKPIDPQILLAKAKIFIKLYQQQQKLKNMVVQLDELANTDTLTGLANRHQFNYFFEKIFESNKRYKRFFALLLIDIDNFKLINDSHGHDVGDELLKQLSKRLMSDLRSSDHVSRLGGDEFSIILSELNTLEEAGYIADMLIKKMSEPLIVNGTKLYATLSIGIATYPSAANSTKELFKAADIALYRAKDLGKNAFAYFTDSLNESYQERAAIEYQIQTSIKNKEIYLVYQPRIDLKTGKILSIEALVRWKNNLLGEMPPAKFIPLSEEIGFIGKLGYHILELAFKQFSEWKKHNTQFNLSLAINISPFQITHQHFIDDIKKLAKTYSVNLNHIEFELTESLFKGQNIDMEAALSEICDLGITLSIDDFGTGYSSLSRLKLLPIKALKIDQSFVRDITTDKNDAAIVQAIISLCKTLQLQAIAEGVETEEQKKFLLENECHIAQGFLLSKPINADDISALLKKEQTP